VSTTIDRQETQVTNVSVLGRHDGIAECTSDRPRSSIL